MYLEFVLSVLDVCNFASACIECSCTQTVFLQSEVQLCINMYSICTLFLIYATLRQHVVNHHVPQICTLFLMYANLHQHIVNNHAPRLCPPWSCRMKDNSVCMQLCINMQLAPLWLKDTKCQRCRCQPWQPATRCLVSTQHTASSASLQEDVSEQKSYYAHQLRFSLVCSLYSFPFDTGYVY